MRFWTLTGVVMGRPLETQGGGGCSCRLRRMGIVGASIWTVVDRILWWSSSVTLQWLGEVVQQGYFADVIKGMHK